MSIYFIAGSCFHFSVFNALLCATDIDECGRGTHDCDPYANCTDTEGSFMCACNLGYEGNGTDCQGKCALVTLLNHKSRSQAYLPSLFLYCKRWKAGKEAWVLG